MRNKGLKGLIEIADGITFIDYQIQIIRSLWKDAEIVVYCASNGCQLSLLAAEALDQAGYSNVSHFVDGLAGWKNAGYAFEGAQV